MSDTVDTTTFLRTLAHARAMTGAEAWIEAAELWEQVVAANPVEGRFWTQLFDACHRSGNFRRAIEAAQQALELGDGIPAEVVYRIACCHAQLGEHEEAVARLEQAFGMGFRHLQYAQDDPLLEPLRGDPRVRELIGLIDTGELSRDEGWRLDLQLVVRDVQRKSHHLFRRISNEEFEAEANRLSEAIPDLTDVQIVVEMMKLLQLLGDGHAGVYGSERLPDLLHALPVQFYLFEEGLYIIAADPQYEGLLGARVLRFGDRTVDEVMEALAPLISRDNEHWLKQVTPYVMRQLPILNALDLIPEPRRLELTYRDLDGETHRAHLTTQAIDPDHVLRRRYPPFPAEWREFAATLDAPLPLYLKNLNLNYWFEYLPDTRTVFFQFNRVANDPNEDLAAFTERLFAFIDTHDVERLVIDIRWNTGGNTFLELPLLHRLIGHQRVNRQGSLFVIIGRRTFSAAQNFTTLVERLTHAVFVGEPTGSSPNFLGETIPIELPYSKMRVNVSDLYWQTSWPMDYRTWVAPLIYTPPTFAAYSANRDPALEAIHAWYEHLPGEVRRPRGA